MHKVNWVQKPLTQARHHSQRLLSILLLTTTATAYLSALPIESAVAQQNSKPPANTRRINRKSVWDSILKLLKRRNEPPLISRGNVCAVTPGLLGEKNVIWSDRPLFLWQGTVQRLQMRPYSLYSSSSSQEVLWSQTVAAGNQSAMYTGEALQPGQTYDWELVVIDPSSPRDSRPRNLRFTFQVMEAQRRALITTELMALEIQLKTAGATAEAISLQRANYFAERDLWSDVLQEVFSVKNPSTALTKTTQEISAYLCGE